MSRLGRPEVMTLFPTRLWTFAVLEGAALNEELASTIVHASQTRPTVPRGEVHGWQSDNTFFQWDAHTRKLGGIVAEAVMTTVREHAPVEDIQLAGWANVFSRGVFYNPHTHADAAWSGTYYVDAGDSDEKTGGMLMFRDPRAGAGMVLTASNVHDNADTFRVRPVTGELLIWPAWLLHWVTPYEGNRPRLSVAFNAR
jgi:uncharacterized protein (TIGR02466 family)